MLNNDPTSYPHFYPQFIHTRKKDIKCEKIIITGERKIDTSRKKIVTDSKRIYTYVIKMCTDPKKISTLERRWNFEGKNDSANKCL